jgi:hypothetical protein
LRAVFLAAAVLAACPASAQPIDEQNAIGTHLDGCVLEALKGQGFTSPRDVTLRLAFRRDGSIIGQPFVSYSGPRRDDPEQARFIAAVRGAFAACAPLPFSKRLGGAIAGKIFSFRYTLSNTKDQDP